MKKKKCTACSKVKPLDRFHKHPGTKDGKHPRCKACRKIQSKKYYRENRDKIIGRMKRRRERKKTSSSYDPVAQKKYYEKNEKELKAKMRQYYWKNREELLKKSREYYKENKEEINEKKKLKRQKQ